MSVVSPSTAPCTICKARAWITAYEGPIRDGTFGRERPGCIIRCQNCGVEVLNAPRLTTEEYYGDGTYRADVGEAADAEDYFTHHDHEQFPRLSLLERVPIRGKVVADVGSGGGSFLDAVRGYASRTVAIEPTRAYHQSLTARGHAVYSDADSARADWLARVDIVVCFSVIEHVEDPVGLLKSIRALLAPGGIALISTPNRDDVLLGFECEAYRKFFYRVVHLYYFNKSSLVTAVGEAGFGSAEVLHRHRFPFGNFIGWLRDGRPSGTHNQTVLGHSFDRAWVMALEEKGCADYLYACLRP